MGSTSLQIRPRRYCAARRCVSAGGAGHMSGGFVGFLCCHKFGIRSYVFFDLAHFSDALLRYRFQVHTKKRPAGDERHHLT